MTEEMPDCLLMYLGEEAESAWNLYLYGQDYIAPEAVGLVIDDTDEIEYE
jgi:hypothetical protein